MDKKLSLFILLFLFYSSFLYCEDRKTSDRGRILNFYSHKHNYLSPVGYADELPNGRNDTEVVFQFSIKIPVIGKKEKTVLFAAYTQRSFWQAYSTYESRPFREHNYNPEVFLKTSGKVYNFDIGIEHESNGKPNPKSRAYNRAYIKFNLNKHYVRSSLKGWYTLSEDQALTVNDKLWGKEISIDEYYGNFELETTIFFGDLHFRNLVRYAFNTGYAAYKGNVSVRINSWVSPFIEYFKGYGDSLIDYNHNIERYMLGIIISR